jgi:hypothetical protein
MTHAVTETCIRCKYTDYGVSCSVEIVSTKVSTF